MVTNKCDDDKSLYLPFNQQLHLRLSPNRDGRFWH